MVGMRAGLDTQVEESVLMLGSFRFRISDCILWLSWVSVVDGIDARRGGRFEASTGSSVLNAHQLKSFMYTMLIMTKK